MSIAIFARRALIATAIAAGTACGQTPADEAALRETIARYEQTWNRHDVAAWSALLAPDADLRYYDWGEVGRDAAVQTVGYNVQTQNLKWEVVRLKITPDGKATVRMRAEFCVEPKPDGHCKILLKGDPASSQWRRDGGQWLLTRFKWFQPLAEADLRGAGID